MKATGAVVRMRVISWGASDDPEPGNELVTASGRRYRIDDVRRDRRSGRVAGLRCTVLDNVYPMDWQPCRVFRWEWASRRRRAAPQLPIVVHPAGVEGSRLRFTIREEPCGTSSIDFVVCFASRRLQWCKSLERGHRAVRLWDRILK